MKPMLCEEGPERTNQIRYELSDSVSASTATAQQSKMAMGLREVRCIVDPTRFRSEMASSQTFALSLIAVRPLSEYSSNFVDYLPSAATRLLLASEHAFKNTRYAITPITPDESRFAVLVSNQSQGESMTTMSVFLQVLATNYPIQPELALDSHIVWFDASLRDLRELINDLSAAYPSFDWSF